MLSLCHPILNASMYEPISKLVLKLFLVSHYRSSQKNLSFFAKMKTWQYPSIQLWPVSLLKSPGKNIESGEGQMEACSNWRLPGNRGPLNDPPNVAFIVRPSFSSGVKGLNTLACFSSHLCIFPARIPCPQAGGDSRYHSSTSPTNVS